MFDLCQLLISRENGRLEKDAPYKPKNAVLNFQKKFLFSPIFEMVNLEYGPYRCTCYIIFSRTLSLKEEFDIK